MGNGQHRNRRGAHPRPGPHKQGGSGNPARATTQLIPPAALTDAVASDASDDRDAVNESEEAPPPPATLASKTSDLAPAAVVDEDAPQDGLLENHQRHHPHHALAEAAEQSDAEAAPRTPGGGAQAGRGRFDRFYTPGQGARAERAERVAPPLTSTLPAVVSAPAPASARRADGVSRVERVERMERASEPVDEDDDSDYTGPHGDVRGGVGGLIDSLHEVFARDRAIATQGSAARCGVCYLHFPVGELIYRDAEGFYVCESCARALGSARVRMVRRQQRQ